MDGKEGKRMNKKKQAGQALLLVAALVLAGCQHDQNLHSGQSL